MGIDPTKVDLKITHKQIKTQTTNTEKQHVPRMGKSILVVLKTSLTILCLYNLLWPYGLSVWRLGRPIPMPWRNLLTVSSHGRTCDLPTCWDYSHASTILTESHFSALLQWQLHLNRDFKGEKQPTHSNQNGKVEISYCTPSIWGVGCFIPTDYVSL